jgi:hypothetical protein
MAVLLTVGAEWRIGEEESEQVGDLALNPDLMRRYLAQVITEMAAARDMSQFDPGECDVPEEDIDPDEDC